MNERVNYCLFGGYRINRARIVTEEALGLNGWMHGNCEWGNGLRYGAIRGKHRRIAPQTEGIYRCNARGHCLANEKSDTAGNGRQGTESRFSILLQLQIQPQLPRQRLI